MADPPPPPQYPVYPYPPPYYGAPPPPAAPSMPGLALTAVILMWVMVALGALGTLSFTGFALLRPELFGELFPGLGSWAPVFMAAYAIQGMTWAVLRSFLAVGVTRRSARARGGAIAVESIGLAFQVAFATVLFAAFFAGPHEGGANFTFDCTGIALPVLVLCFLSATRSRLWCDR